MSKASGDAPQVDWTNEMADESNDVSKKGHTIPKVIGVALLSALVVTYACLLFGWTVTGAPARPGFIILVTAIIIGVVYRKAEDSLTSSYILAAGAVGVVTGLVLVIIQIAEIWDYLPELSDYYNDMAQSAGGGINEFFWGIKQIWVDYFVSHAGDGLSIGTILSFILIPYSSAAFYIGALLSAGIPYGIAKLVEWIGEKVSG